MGLGGGIRGGALGGALSGEVEFDSGLSMPARTALRKHTVARLQPLLKSSTPAGYLHKIERIPAPLTGRGDEEMKWLVNAIGVQIPCVVIALGDEEAEYTGLGGDESRGRIAVHLYVADGSPRGYVDGRLEADQNALADPTADPGIDIMLEHIEQLLSGQVVNLYGANEFRLQRTSPVETFAEYTIWEQHYEVWVDRDVKPWRGITKVVTSIEVQHTLPGTDAPVPLVDTITTLKVQP